jgi:MerR family transcriptional regulator, light-induced transcriptional regulator
MEAIPGRLRIGELSRRVGVSPELLRAWERRYGLLQPSRSAGGFRLYSEADEERVGAMQVNLARGLSAAEAARSALELSARQAADSAEAPPPDLSEARMRLQSALEGFDETEAHAQFDRLLATYGADSILVEVILPVLRAMGDGWVAGRVTIAQEHFASNVLRGRLLGLARGWGRGVGPLAVLACPPGEQHDLSLLMFGIALREAGWRISFLGVDTPIATIETAAAALGASIVVLSAVAPGPIRAVEAEVAELARRTTVALGGPAADPALAERVGAVLLQGDPVAAASGLVAGLGS